MLLLFYTQHHSSDSPIQAQTDVKEQTTTRFYFFSTYTTTQMLYNLTNKNFTIWDGTYPPIVIYRLADSVALDLCGWLLALPLAMRTTRLQHHCHPWPYQYQRVALSPLQ